MEEETNSNGSQPTAPVVDPEQLRVATIAELRVAASEILLDRLKWANQMGITYGDKRDMFNVLGYSRQLTARAFRDRYERGGLAGRIVDAYPNATWRGMPAFEIIENERKKTYTPFEQAWVDLDLRLQMTSTFLRADKLSRLSTYAIILIGAAGDLEKPLPRATKVNSGAQLLYLTPFNGGGGPGGRSTSNTVVEDADATIHEYETDSSSPRFGLPKSYRIKRMDISMQAKTVHWTRVLHIAENVLTDEIFGQPALERVWNLLDDLDKISGGGAEAFWLRANQGLHVDVDKDMKLADAQNTIAALKEQAELYQHQMVRWLRTRGVKVTTLGSDVANFSDPADAILTQIAGATSIPKRILTGSEMGELASTQDRDNWRDQIIGRQTQYAGPCIVRQLVNRLIEFGYLPTPAKGPIQYEVRWPHIQTLTEQERTAGAQAWASVNATYGDVVFTKAEIRDHWHHMEPLSEQQLAEEDERAEEKVKRAQELMQEAQPAEIPEEDEDEEPTARAAQERRYSSTEVRLPEPVAGKLLAYGAAIPYEDLAEEGCEKNPHITVKYGLHTNDVGEVRVALQDITGPIQLTLGKTAVFEGENHDAVYVKVTSPDLTRLNALLTERTPNTTTHDYVPHATIAYVKKGEGEKYAGSNVVEGMKVSVDRLIFGPAINPVVTWDQEIIFPPTPTPLAERVAQLAEDELVRVLSTAIEDGNTEVIHAIIGLHAEHDQSTHGRGGGDSDKQDNWAAPQMGVKSVTFNGPERDVHRKAAAKEATKQLTNAGFKKEQSEKKHTPSQKMGRSEAYSGTFDKRETVFKHDDGRKARLVERWSKYGPHSVSVFHERESQPS